MKEKGKILLVLSVTVILIMLLHLMFGITHKFDFINAIFYIIYIVIICLNIIYIKNNKIGIISKILHLLFCLIIAILSIIILFWFVIYHTGPQTILDEYYFPNQTNEKLKVLYVDEGGGGPTNVIYEKEFILGIKCSISIKMENVSSGELVFDLESIYNNELKENKNSGFCYYRLRKE